MATVDEAENEQWPDRLRLSVLRTLAQQAGRRCDLLSDLDVHHVVAGGLEWARPARVVLARWSISINDVANAAILPRRFHQQEGLHRRGFLDVINRRMLNADRLASGVGRQVGKAGARLIITKTIQNMGDELVLRSGDRLASQLQEVIREQSRVLEWVARGMESVGPVPLQKAPRVGRRGLGAGLRLRMRADDGNEGELVAGGSGLPLAAAGGRRAMDMPERHGGDSAVASAKACTSG